MIRVIGTGHVLERSVRDVERVVGGDSPDIIALELDVKRFKALMERRGVPDSCVGDFDFKSLLRGVWGGGSFPVLLGGLLALIQRDLGRKFGVRPGSEMVAAIQLARTGGSKVALIDRDVEITLNHVLSIPLKEKIRLFTKNSYELELVGNLLGTDVDGLLREENIERIMVELKKNLPGLYSALVDERDRYMAHMLLKLQEAHPDATIIAIVGAGHRRGIGYYLKKTDFADIEKLTEFRPVSRLQLIPLVFTLAVTYILMKIEFIKIGK